MFVPDILRMTRKIGESISAEDMPVKRKDGRVFYATIRASRLKLAERMYLMGIFINTTERNQMLINLENARIAARNVYEDLLVEKEALAHAKAKDEAMLASIGDGLVVVDTNMRVILINKVAEVATGWSNSEVLNKRWQEVIMVENEDGKKTSINKSPLFFAISSGKTTTVTANTYYYTRKDKTKFPVAITVSPVKIENKIIGAIIVFRDITQEKEIEKLRMDFLSLASHQLRTPLSGTKWLIETIQRGVTGELNSKQKEYVNNLYKVNERMIRLVSDMLNVLVLESGVAVINKQKIQLSKLFEELLLMMEPVSKNKGVTLWNGLKNHKLIFIETDLQIVRSILECLVSNAINYSQSGQEVVLDAKQESNAVVFSVKDSGIGIPKKEQPRIFERFYRASNAKDLRPNGTGLGLNIAKMLAQKIGADVSFESKENKGSIFYLRIPKKSSESAQAKN